MTVAENVTTDSMKVYWLFREIGFSFRLKDIYFKIIVAIPYINILKEKEGI